MQTISNFRPAQRIRVCRTTAVLSLALLATGLAWADPSPATPTPTTTTTAKTSAKPKAKTGTSKATSPTVRLPTIVVTAATRNTQPVSTTATSTTVLTHQDLQSGQYTAVSDALQTIPGIEIRTNGTPGALTSVFLRGTEARQSLFTIDGRRQPVGIDGAYNFANLTLDNIEQIEVVRTPSSSLQGGSAMGGVINLVTLSGRGLDHPESSVSFEGGSFSTYRENVQSRGSEGNFDYAVSASNLDTNGNRANDNFRNTVYRGNFGYQATPDIYLDLHTGYSIANDGSPNAIEYPDPVARLQTEDWFISPGVTAKVTDFYTTKFYFNHDQQRQTFHDLFNDFFMNFASSNRLQVDTDSIDWQNNFQVAHNWQITAGIQGDNTSVYQFDDFAGMRTLQNGLTNIGGYVESQWEPLAGLNVISSLRRDHYSDFSGAFSWRQGVSYKIAPTQTIVHASGASAYTPPSISNLYSPFASNPNLKPEKSLGWEVGVEQPLEEGKVTPSVTYFHNHISNYIQAPPPTFVPMNIANAMTEGAEVDIKARPIDELTLDLNYTYLTAENVTKGVRLIGRPRNTLNFTSAWTPIPPLTLSMGGSWIVGRQDIDPLTFAQVGAPDYFVMRAGATYKVNSNVTLWVRGENLADTHYQPSLGFPSLGLGGYGGIKISF